MELDDEPTAVENTPRHSPVGIAAFIASLISICILVSYFVLIFAVAFRWIDLPFLTVLVSVIVCVSLLSLVTLILSIISFFQKVQSKLFGTLALIVWLITILILFLTPLTFFLFTGA